MTGSGFNATRYQKQVHLTAGCVCVAMAGLQFFAASGRTAATRSERESVLTAQQQLISQLDPMQQRRTTLVARERDLREQLLVMRRRIPASSGEHAFLNELADAAETCGVEIQEFQPGESTIVERHVRIELRLTTTSSFGGLCQFLAAVRGIERLCSVEECRISVPERAKDMLRAELTLAVFSASPVEVARSVGEPLQ